MIKKVILTAVAAALLTGCSSKEPIQSGKDEFVDFGVTSTIALNSLAVVRDDEDFQSLTLEQIDEMVAPQSKDLYVYNKELAFVERKKDLYNDDVEELYGEQKPFPEEYFEIQQGETELSRLFKQTYHMSKQGDAQMLKHSTHILEDIFNILHRTDDRAEAIMPAQSELKKLDNKTFLALPYAFLQDNEVTGKQDLVIRVQALSRTFQKAADVQAAVAKEVVTYNGHKAISRLEYMKNNMAAMEDGVEKDTEEKIIRILEKLNYHYFDEYPYYISYDYISDFKEQMELEENLATVPNQVMLSDFNEYELMPGELLEFEFYVEGIDELIYTPLSEDDYDVFEIGYHTFEDLSVSNFDMYAGIYGFDPETLGIYRDL